MTSALRITLEMATPLDDDDDPMEIIQLISNIRGAVSEMISLNEIGEWNFIVEEYDDWVNIED